MRNPCYWCCIYHFTSLLSTLLKSKDSACLESLHIGPLGSRITSTVFQSVLISQPWFLSPLFVLTNYCWNGLTVISLGNHILLALHMYKFISTVPANMVHKYWRKNYFCTEHVQTFSHVAIPKTPQQLFT